MRKTQRKLKTKSKVNKRTKKHVGGVNNLPPVPPRSNRPNTYEQPVRNPNPVYNGPPVPTVPPRSNRPPSNYESPFLRNPSVNSRKSGKSGNSGFNEEEYENVNGNKANIQPDNSARFRPKPPGLNKLQKLVEKQSVYSMIPNNNKETII